MSSRSSHRSLLVTGLAALSLVAGLAVQPATAAPAGWTSPERIPGTSGAVNQVSATAPDGTDVVVWVASVPDDQVAIRGRVRAPGTTEWVKMQAYVTDRAQDIKLAADRYGDFWVTWVRYNPNTGIPQVLVSRLDSDTAKLTAPQQPFVDAGYGHQTPQISVTNSGTVFVATTASPKASSNPPTYRAEVGIKRPGDPWRTRFLSPADDFAAVRTLAVSPNGHAMVMFIQGYESAETRVRAATRPAGSDSAWTVSDVSPAGDAAGARAAIGPNGMAAIEWNAPSNGNEIVRLAYRNVTSDGSWVSTDLVTGPGFHQVETPVVDPDGYITAFWWDGRVWARQVQDGVMLTANAVSPAGVRSDMRAVLMGNDGLAAVVYQSYDNNLDNLGLRLRWVDHGVAYEENVLTASYEGSANTVQMGLDAADHVNVVWTAGDYPIVELRSLGNPPAAPSVVTAPNFGEAVTAASLTGRPRVGRVLTCGAGYVVEATEVNWRWYRQGNRISGETGRTYRLRDADKGKRIKCAMVARGLEDLTTLMSPARRIR